MDSVRSYGRKKLGSFINFTLILLNILSCADVLHSTTAKTMRTLFLLLIRSSTCNILIYKVYSLLNMILEWILKLEANLMFWLANILGQLNLYVIMIIVR